MGAVKLQSADIFVSGQQIFPRNVNALPHVNEYWFAFAAASL